MATSLHSHRQWKGDCMGRGGVIAQLAWFFQDSDYSLHLLQLQKLSERAGQLELQLSWFLIANCWQVNLVAFLQVLSTYLYSYSFSVSSVQSIKRMTKVKCQGSSLRVCVRVQKAFLAWLHSYSLLQRTWKSNSENSLKKPLTCVVFTCRETKTFTPPPLNASLKRGKNWTAHFLCKGKTTTKKKTEEKTKQNTWETRKHNTEKTLFPGLHQELTLEEEAKKARILISFCVFRGFSFHRSPLSPSLPAP